ncbi:MAG: hypothetical protein DHS20C02_16840 [Micavibrio sp.]|nr:MAG: hypothetical protein DHS20C02_16840 [Micavibrio sp.]
MNKINGYTALLLLSFAAVSYAGEEQSKPSEALSGDPQVRELLLQGTKGLSQQDIEEIRQKFERARSSGASSIVDTFPSTPRKKMIFNGQEQMSTIGEKAKVRLNDQLQRDIEGSQEVEQALAP